MKAQNLFLFVSICLATVACKKDVEKISDTKSDSASVENKKNVEPELHKEMYGLYTGEFIGKEKFKDEIENKYE